MEEKKNIFAIVGSASENSANQKLVEKFAELTAADFNVTIYKSLKKLPHFDPELSISNPPQQVLALRKAIEAASGILICTPEYVFSIPSGLKNAIEWCVSTTVFNGKPTGLITASAHGEKGHEELQLIMETVMAAFIAGTTLLIKGIRGKIDGRGEIIDNTTKENYSKFIQAYKTLIKNNQNS